LLSLFPLNHEKDVGTKKQKGEKQNSDNNSKRYAAATLLSFSDCDSRHRRAWVHARATVGIPALLAANVCAESGDVRAMKTRGALG
jgi:hypothetical protein